MTLVPLNNAEIKPLRKVQATPVLNPLQQQAQDLTALQYNPQQSAIERALTKTDQNLQTGINTQNTFAQNVDPRVQGAYQSLQDVLQKNLGITQGIYSGAADKVGAGYDFASGQAQSTSDAILGRLGASAQNLGQQQALPGVQQNITDELGLIQSLLSSGKAGAVGNLNALGANMQAIGQQGISDAAHEGTQVRGDLQKGALDAITKLQLGAQGETNDYLAQLMDVMASRGLSEKTTLRGLESDKASSDATAAKNAFDQMMALRRDARDEANSSSTRSKNEADIAKTLGLTGADKTDVYAKGSGTEGLNAWFNANLKGPSGKQKHDYGYFKGGVERLIQDSELKAAAASAKGVKKNAKAPDPYQVMLDTIAQQADTPAGKSGKYVFQSPDGKVKAFSVQEILDAARTYFGKGGSATGTSGKPLA